jgi:hypothetical protein
MPVALLESRERWALFFRYCIDPERRDLVNEILKAEEGVAMAAEVLLTVSRDLDERFRLEREFRRKLDIQSEMASARHKGLAEGEAKEKRPIWKRHNV